MSGVKGDVMGAVDRGAGCARVESFRQSTAVAMEKIVALKPRARFFFMVFLYMAPVKKTKRQGALPLCAYEMSVNYLVSTPSSLT